MGLGTVRVEPVGLFFVARKMRYQRENVFSALRYHDVWYAEDPEKPACKAPGWNSLYSREASCYDAQSPTGKAEPFSNRRDRLQTRVKDTAAAKALLLGDTDKVILPVHYPRSYRGDVEGENFQWFVGNDGGKHNNKTASNKGQWLRPLGESAQLQSLERLVFPDNPH